MRASLRSIALSTALSTAVIASLVVGCSRQLPTAPERAGFRSSGSMRDGGGVSETPTVVRSSGAIEADVAAFRALLGDPNNLSAPGQQPGGRREVNWDGVPAELTNIDEFPNDFFNKTVTRGLFYNRTGHGLEVSDQGFADVDPAYAGEFNTFS